MPPQLPPGIQAMPEMLDEVVEKRQPSLITKHGKPVAQLIPAAAEKNRRIEKGIAVRWRHHLSD